MNLKRLSLVDMFPTPPDRYRSMGETPWSDVLMRGLGAFIITVGFATAVSAMEDGEVIDNISDPNLASEVAETPNNQNFN